MNTLSFTFPNLEPELEDILIAELGEAGFTGFEQEGGILTAFIPEGAFIPESFNHIMERYQLHPGRQTIPEQNWNALWEANFEPVQVNGFCGIRAHFHPPFTNVAHEIVITPKMSFGTGHHATTWMMIQAMQQIDMKGKTVCDFGSGTGVLAILAEKLGAAAVLAIDNDNWCITNATENIAGNNCSRITLQLAETMPDGVFEVVLANINLPVLLQSMTAFRQSITPGGCLLLSGILETDIPQITTSLVAAGFRPQPAVLRGKWACINARRQPEAPFNG